MLEKERQLLASARKGCVDAFEELIAPYAAGIYNLMLKTAGNEFEASLLAQDVFVRVFELLISGDFRGGLAFNIYKSAGEISRRAAGKTRMIS